jgi:hypothetical protein
VLPERVGRNSILNIKNNKDAFEVPAEWLCDAGMENFVPSSRHYRVNHARCSKIVPINEIEPPLRDNGKRWFRDREAVVYILQKIRIGEEIEPIEVWSKEKKNSTKYVVRDGFHRFYLSVALGYREIPIKLNDFDMYEFFDKERQGT